MPDTEIATLSSMNRLTLRFRDPEAENRYLRSTDTLRKMQMRLALLFVGLLYAVLGILDRHFMPEQVRQLASVIHLAQGGWLCLSSLLLFRIASQGVHASVVMTTVFIAWNLNLMLTTMGNTDLLFGEAYLMIIWVWMIDGLSLRQAAWLNLVFIVIFESVMALWHPFDIDRMLSHHFFILVSIVLGALGAYLTEFYRRQHFVSLEQISAQTSALAAANTQLANDHVALMKLSQAVEQSGESILITDNRAVIEYANPTFTETTGYLAEDVIGKTPAIVGDDAENSDFAGEIRSAIRQGKAWSGTLVDKKRGGEPYPALVSVAPIQNDCGEITHYVFTQKDMTQHQRLEAQFRHAQKMEAVGTLVGGIAHDFNNTLAGITGNLYLAKQGVAHLPDTVDILNRIEMLAFRSSDIVKQLLAFSRKGIVNMNTMNITTFFSDVANLYSVILPENIVFHRQDSAACEMTVCGDENQLEQAVLNLLNNARDAVADIREPEITLQLEKRTPSQAFRQEHELQGSEFACISVIDNGCGIEKEALEHIFEPFYTTKEVDEGSGLGLSMAYGTAQSHRGTITVESRPGQGSAIRLYLPLLNEKPVRLTASTKPLTARGSGDTILLADDNESVLKIVTAILEQLGYQVILAMDGLTAVELYKRHRNDIRLVILDVVMPRMGGIEACREIRDMDDTAKVIFLTGYDPDQQFNTREGFPEVVVTKPFEVAAFSQLVKSQLER
ncbi:MAG TPA: ATP-binding protein [Mariprofundaceae bacterium]|nr:ATP-binding protein [Mariprofundaceae bacterium]